MSLPEPSSLQQCAATKPSAGHFLVCNRCNALVHLHHYTRAFKCVAHTNLTYPLQAQGDSSGMRAGDSRGGQGRPRPSGHY